MLSRQKSILVNKYLGLHGCQRAESASDLGFSRLKGHTIFHCSSVDLPSPTLFALLFPSGSLNSPYSKIKSEHCQLSPKWPRWQSAEWEMLARRCLSSNSMCSSKCDVFVRWIDYETHFPTIHQQKPGGLMFPDRAALYVVAIEDRQYKDFKIHCKSPFVLCWASPHPTPLCLGWEALQWAWDAQLVYKHTAMSVEFTWAFLASSLCNLFL